MVRDFIIIAVAESGIRTLVNYGPEMAYLYCSPACSMSSMLGFTTIVLAANLAAVCIQTAIAIHPPTIGPQGVNLWKLNVGPQRSSHRLMGSTQRPDYPARTDETQHTFEHEPEATILSKKYDFRAQWFEQPLDHFDKISKHRFHQRYWVNSRHYKPRKGAPVIILDGGETNGEVCLYRIACVGFPDLAS
jgi:hypothetical protein